MRIYEEYASPAAKRQAQRGAKLGKATGKAKGYLFVFDEDGRHLSGREVVYDALGEILEVADGKPCSIASVTPSLGYLRTQCRRVGFSTIPQEWKAAFARKLDDCLDPTIPELADQRRRYRNVLRHAEVERANACDGEAGGGTFGQCDEAAKQ